MRQKTRDSVKDLWKDKSWPKLLQDKISPVGGPKAWLHTEAGTLPLSLPLRLDFSVFMRWSSLLPTLPVSKSRSTVTSIAGVYLNVCLLSSGVQKPTGENSNDDHNQHCCPFVMGCRPIWPIPQLPTVGSGVSSVWDQDSPKKSHQHSREEVEPALAPRQPDLESLLLNPAKVVWGSSYLTPPLYVLSGAQDRQV